MTGLMFAKHHYGFDGLERTAGPTIRPPTLCMLMVGHAFHDRHESNTRASDKDQLEPGLLLLVSRALELTTRTNRTENVP